MSGAGIILFRLHLLVPVVANKTNTSNGGLWSLAAIKYIEECAYVFSQSNLFHFPLVFSPFSVKTTSERYYLRLPPPWD